MGHEPLRLTPVALNSPAEPPTLFPCIIRNVPKIIGHLLTQFLAMEAEKEPCGLPEEGGRASLLIISSNKSNPENESESPVRLPNSTLSFLGEIICRDFDYRRIESPQCESLESLSHAHFHIRYF